MSLKSLPIPRGPSSRRRHSIVKISRIVVIEIDSIPFTVTVEEESEVKGSAEEA